MVKLIQEARNLSITNGDLIYIDNAIRDKSYAIFLASIIKSSSLTLPSLPRVLAERLRCLTLDKDLRHGGAIRRNMIDSERKGWARKYFHLNLVQAIVVPH